MTDSKLLDIVEDIKTLSTSGNKIQVEEYKNKFRNSTFSFI